MSFWIELSKRASTNAFRWILANKSKVQKMISDGHGITAILKYVESKI